MRNYFLLFLIAFTAISLNAQYDAYKVNGPYNGEVSKLEAGPGDVLFAGTWGDGIYRSGDKGENWTQINTGLDDLYINDFDFSDSKILVATNGGGFYVSDDNGNNWVQKNNGLYNEFVMSVAAKSDDTFFATTRGNGVFRTTDGGDNWEEVNEGLWFQDMGKVFVSEAGTVIVSALGKGLYRSTDDGETWDISTSGMNSDFITEIKTAESGQIFASTSGAGLFQSDNDGANWIPWDADSLLDLNITSFVVPNEGSDHFPVVGTKKWGIWWYHEFPYDYWESTIYWDGACNDLTILSDGTIFAATPYQGIIRSDDGGEIWDLANDFRKTRFFAAVGAKGSTVIVTGDNREVWRSEDYGLTWSEVTSGLDSLLTPATRVKFSGNEVLMLTNFRFFKSINDGQDWTYMEIPEATIPDQAEHNKNIELTSVEKGSGNTYYITFNAVYTFTGDGEPPATPDPINGYMLTTDNGANWSYVSLNSIEDNKITDITRSSTSVMYISANNEGVYRSTDQGQNWNLNADQLDGLEINSVAAVTNSTAFLGTEDGLFKTTDRGGSWNKIDMEIPWHDFGSQFERVGRVAVGGTKNVYVGFLQNTGVYKSTNLGNDFDSLNHSIYVRAVKDIATNEDADMFYLTSSLWRHYEPDGMPSPELISPADEEGDISFDFDDTDGRKPLIMEWENTDKADMYQIQLSESDDFLNVISNSVFKGTSRSYTFDLMKGHTYHWRVRSKHAESYSDWETYSFTTELPAPDLLYPADSSIGVPVQAELRWSEVELATEYDIQIAQSTDLQDIVYEANGVSGTTTITDQLENYTEYVWRARSKNENSSSRWSDWAVFTTIVPAPELIYPEDNGTSIPVDLTFRFGEVIGSDDTYIQISRDTAFTIENIIFDSRTDSDTTHFFDILNYQEDYYWRLRCSQIGTNADGEEETFYSSWSEIRKFTTGIASPVLISPPNNQIDVSNEPRLIWEIFNDADSYVYQVSTDQDFNDVIFTDTTTSIEIDLEELEYYEVYYWRVQVIIGGDAGLWSEVWKFRTVLDQVTLEGDFCGSVDTKLNVRIDWEELKGADLYEIEVADNQSFLDPEVTQNEIELNNTIVEVTKFQTTYYARVRGYNDESTGPWSTPCSFTTSVNSVEELIEAMDVNVYPNPFAETVTINFNMTQVLKVKLEIYDMVGNIVYIDDLGTIGIGNHEIQWKASSANPGNYYYKLLIGDSEKIGEMVLVK